MKNLFIVFVNLIFLVFVLLFGIQSFMNSQNSEIIVDCTPTYSTTYNELTMTCDVVDQDQIITTDNPLTITLLDHSGYVVLEHDLSPGNNLITYDSLFYNQQYSILVEGENINQREYVPSVFYEYDFSTVSENIQIPIVELYEQTLTDTTFGFDVILTDIDARVVDIMIELYLEDDTLIDQKNANISPGISIQYTSLLPETQYHAEVYITYTINDLTETAVIHETINFTTIPTPLTPSASITNLVYDNMTLEFDLALLNNDASNVFYTLEIVSSDSTVIYAVEANLESYQFDVSEIVGNYDIVVKASYLFNGETYQDDEIFRLHLYNNEYANFFNIPTLQKTDTSQPLSNYQDYEKYLFTYLDEGITEFTIYCQSPVDCTELVENPLYSEIPFAISNFLHPYYDINAIGYSYTTSKIDFTTEVRYTETDMLLVNQEITNILNAIITEGMTDYQKILTVHDYIINLSEYDVLCDTNNETCDNDHVAMGVLFDYNAVCEGYAQTMDIFLRALRIPAFRLSSETHQWNVVHYNDKWYHLDATWDDPVTHNGTDILTHTYFLITTDTLHALDDSSAHDFSTIYANFIE